MKNLDLSIVIPTYNEEKIIQKTLKEVNDFFNIKGLVFEIIIADDGSSDATLKKVRELIGALNTNIILLETKENRGKGHALKRGFEASSGGIILFTDADLSTPLKEFDNMFPCLRGGYDIVMGSRHLPGSKIAIHQSRLREFLGKIFYKIIFTLLIKNITDTNCGFKAYNKKAGKHLYSNLTIDRWGFDTEIIYLAQKYDYKIKEVPVEWYNNSDSKVSMLKAVRDTLKEITKIKINAWKGKYKNRENYEK